MYSVCIAVCMAEGKAQQGIKQHVNVHQRIVEDVKWHTAHLQGNSQADWMLGCQRWIPDAAVHSPLEMSTLGPLAAIVADR